MVAPFDIKLSAAHFTYPVGTTDQVDRQHLGSLGCSTSCSLHWIMQFSLIRLQTEFGRETQSGDVQSERRQLSFVPDNAV